MSETPWSVRDHTSNLPERRILLICGVLILSAFPLYGGGQALMSEGQFAIGLTMSLANSAAVIAIGLLLRPIIAQSAPKVAWMYLVARLFEGLALAAGALVWATFPDSADAQATNALLYQLAMGALALGSLPFCHWLVTSRRLPALIGWGGLIGYMALGAAMAAQQAGSEGLAMWLLIPGALFELVFGIMLIAGRVRHYAPSMRPT